VLEDIQAGKFRARWMLENKSTRLVQATAQARAIRSRKVGAKRAT